MSLRRWTALPMLLFAGVVLAEDPHLPNLPTAAAAATSTLTRGEIRAIDPDNQRLTIRHGDIENLGMPGMTMVFKVKPPATIDNLKPGDKIRFHAEREAGNLIVTEVHTDNPSQGELRP